jgi:hypothetical protein
MRWPHLSEGEIDDLLPFFAIGRLSPADMRRVGKALESEPALRAKLELVLEEQAVTVKVNEERGRPSPQVAERFLARLQAEPPRLRTISILGGLGNWFRRAAILLAPRSFAGLGFATGAVVAIQAVALGALITGPERRPPPNQFDPQFPAEIHEGCAALAKFTPDAKLAEVAGRLTEVKATIINGPKTNGFYQLSIRVQEGGPDCVGLISRLASDKGLVEFVSRSP